MKIWSRSVLALVAGTMVFSGCLKNIEPEGLADLRGAKAELLRAQTAVEAANAAKVNADAALVLAQAKVQEALAKQAEAKAAYDAALARLQELEVEKQTALNAIEIEKAIAQAQAEITEAEAKAAKVAAEAEKELLTVLQDVAKLQMEYENALKNLALAAATLTEPQQTQLTAMQEAVETARQDVALKTVEFENAAIELTYALSLVDDEAAKQTVVRYAEIALLKAQAVLEGAVEAEAIAKAAVELDLPTVADWRAKAQEYWAEAEKLEADYWKRYGEIEDAMSAMKDSIAVDKDNDNNTVPVGAIAVKKANYTAYTGYLFHEDAGVFAQTRVVETAVDDTRKPFDVPYIEIKAPVDSEGYPIAADFTLEGVKYYYGEEDAVIKQFEDALKGIAKKDALFYETMISIIGMAKDQIQNDPKYKYDLAKYNDAVAAYQSGDILSYYNKYVFDKDFDLAVAVKEYNEAVAVLDAAVKNFNDNYDKYDYDFSEEYKAVEAAKVKAYTDAAIKKAKAYQDAEEVNKYTYNRDHVWPSAKDAWENAQNVYDAAVDAAEVAGGDTKENMEAWVKANPTPTTDADKAKLSKYNAALDAIKTAATAKTAAEKAYNDAEKAWKTVDEAYKKAIAAADKAEVDAQKAADDKYAKDIDAIDAKYYPNFDATYMLNLLGQVTEAKNVAQKKVNVINSVIGVFGYSDPRNATYELSIEFMGVPTHVAVTDVPVFMVDGTYDGTDYNYALKTVEVADFVIKEYFISGVIADLADGLTDNYRDYAGYPLQLPTFEECCDYLETHKDPTSFLYLEALADELVASLEAKIAALDQLPDFAKAIEAAKAEFEALVKENADKLAADKAEVEAFYARYIPLKEKNEKELEAMKAKTDVVVARLEAIGGIVDAYCGEDEDYLTEALYAQYEAAAMMLSFAEASVYEAEVDLEKAKNGLVTLVEFAQMNYDAASTDLAVAIATLEGATAALENAIAVIYGVEPVAPQAPVTPPADDDTTDEGGEAEGGEAEGGEGAE